MISVPLLVRQCSDTGTRAFQKKLLLIFAYLLSPNLGLTPPRDLQAKFPWVSACSGSNSFWTRTLDCVHKGGLPECVVSTMSVPPPKTTQDRTQTKDTHPIPGQKLKFLTPPGIGPRPPGWKATATSSFHKITCIYQNNVISRPPLRYSGKHV